MIVNKLFKFPFEVAGIACHESQKKKLKIEMLV